MATKQKEGGKEKDFLIDWSKSNEEILKEYNSLYGTNKKNILMSSNEPIDGGRVDMSAARQYTELVDAAGNVQKTFLRVPKITLDKNTGGIKVSGPGRIINSQSFRSKIEPTLKTISKAYKTDPNAAFPVFDAEGNETGETENIDQMLEKLNSADPSVSGSMGYFAEALYQLDDIKKHDKERYGIDINIRDEDMGLRTSVLLSGDGMPKPRDTDRQAISDAIGEPWLKKLQTYDPETRTAEYKDIMDNLWNRELGFTDEELRGIRNNIQNRILANAYEDSEEGSKQAASDMAFLEFLYGEKPEMAWYRTAVEATGQAIEGVARSSINFVNSTISFWNAQSDAFSDKMKGFVADTLNIDADGKLLGGIIDITSKTASHNPASDLVDAFDIAASFIDKKERFGSDEHFWDNEIQDFYKDQQEEREMELEFLDPKAKAAGKFAEGVTDLVILIGTSKIAGQVSGAMLSGASSAITSGAGKAAGLLSNAAKLGAGTANGLNKVAAATRAISFIGAAAPKVVGSLANMTAKMLNSGVTTNSVRILAESLNECVLLEPELMRKLVASGDLEPEARNMILSDIAGNVGGEIVGLGTSKALIKAGQTAIGSAVSSNISTWLAKRQAKFGRIHNRVRVTLSRSDDMADYITKLSSSDSKWKQKKAQAILSNQMSLINKNVVADADYIKILGKNTDEIKSGIKKYQNQIAEFYQNENLIDDIARHNMGYINGVTVGDRCIDFKVANNEFYKAYQNAIKAETSAGIAKTTNEVGESSRLLSQKTINYAVGQNRIEILQNFINKFDGQEGLSDTMLSKLKSAQSELGHWTSVVDEFRATASKELIEAADILTFENKRWNAAFTDMCIRDNTLSAEAIASLKSSGLWGENGEDYMRIQRKQDLDEISVWNITRTDQRSMRDVTTATDHYKFGSTDDFEDPLLVTFKQLQRQAEVYNRSTLLKNLSGASGANVLMSGKDVKFAKEIKSATGSFENVLNKGIDAVVDSITKTGIADIEAAFRQDIKGLKSAQGNLAHQTKATAGALADTTSAGSRTERKALVLGATDNKIDDYWRAVYGDADVAEYMKSLATNPASVPASIRTMVKEQYEEMVHRGVYASIHLPYQEGSATAHAISELSQIDASSLTSQQLREKVVSVIGKDNADQIISKIRKGKKSSYTTKSKLPKLNRQDFYRLTGTNSKTIPPEVKQFLSNHGVKFEGYEDIINQIPALRNIANSKETFTSEDVIAFYKRVGRQADPNAFTVDEVVEGIKKANMEDALDKAFRGPDVRAKLAKLPKGDLTYEQYVKLAADDDTLNRRIKRMAMSEDNSVLDSAEFKEAAGEEIRANHIMERQIAFDNAEEAEREAREIFNLDSNAIDSTCDDVFRTYMENISKSPEVERYINALSEKYPGIDKETLTKFFVLQHMEKNSGALKEKLAKKIASQMGEKLKGLTGSDAGLKPAINHISNRVAAKFTDEFDGVNALMQDIAPELVDQKALHKEVRNLCNQLEGLAKQDRAAIDGVVGVANEAGQLEYIEVDPLLSIFARSSEKIHDMGSLEKINYLWMKSFRLGTTTLSIRSAMRQSFTDTANAFIGGGWFFDSSKNLMDDAYNVLGDNVTDFIRAYSSDLADAVKAGEKTSREAFEEITKSAMSTGKATATTATETAQYSLGKKYQNKQMAQRYGRVDNQTLDAVSDHINNAIDKMGAVNEFREKFLRNATYQKAYSTAIKKGLSNVNAIEYAKFVQSNATTNFSRTMEHLTALQRTVPYLGAAVNGTKSFFRLASMDPVGVFGRLFGGIGVPMMYLTAKSLSNEDDRKIWKNIKEYQKDGNIVFVEDGKVFTIPIPPEIGAFVNPFRQIVEDMYDANPHTFWELAANDMIGLSPIELDGFINIDHNSLSGDNNLLNNVPIGLTKVWSQLAPAPLKSAMMAITHIDPYTMTNVDTSRVVVNYDTHEIEVMDNRAGAFAQQLAKTSLAHNLGISASLAEKLVQNIVGIAGLDLADWLTEFSVGIADEGLTGAGKALVSGLERVDERLSDPFTTHISNRADSEWYAAVNELREEQDSIIHSDTFKAYMKKAQMVYREGDQQEILGLMQDRQNIFGQYFEDVKTIATNLKNKYPDNFTADKFASVLSLMTLNVPAGDYTGTRGQELLQDLKYDSEQRAIATMMELGFPEVAPKDSVLGGFYTSPYTGEVKREQYTPMPLRDMQNKLWHSETLHQANLRKVLDDAGLDRGAMFEGYGDLNRLEKKKHKKVWNQKVILAIAPYMQKYGVDNVLSDASTRDVLDDILFVDGQWKADQYLKEIFEGI